jgi:hypothetical protein
MEMKDDDSTFIDAADADEAFEIKSHLEPVLQYHGIVTEIYKDGILVKDYLSDEAIDALSVALDAYDSK